MLLEIIHQLGVKIGELLTRSKQEELKTIIDQPVINGDVPEQEIWNVVTSHGKYKEAWQVYRHSGLLEAIKSRDEKAEFDQKMSKIENPEQFDHSLSQKNFLPQPVHKKLPLANSQNSDGKIDELDLALVQSIASYLEAMNGKILHYYRHHNASREEAEIIASHYLKIAKFFRNARTRQDLEELLKSTTGLKEKVGRYQHKSYKYRWSTSLEREVIVKLTKVLDAFT
jgi:hypothetical protein